MRRSADNYEAMCERLFGHSMSHGDRDKPQLEAASKDMARAGRAEAADSARPSLGNPAGLGILLTATTVVHELLALPEIRDPERWLIRHGAPVAINTGRSKRYLAADILDWAADQFAARDASKATLREMAHSLRRTGSSTTPTKSLPLSPDQRGGE